MRQQVPAHFRWHARRWVYLSHSCSRGLVRLRSPEWDQSTVPGQTPSYFGRHPCRPDAMTSGHQIMTSAAIPSPSSRTSRRRSRPALVRAVSWLASSSTSGPDSTCGQPPLTVFTTVVSANAIVYDSQLDLFPSGSPSRATFDQRSPALWRGVTAVGICPGEGRHPTRGLARPSMRTLGREVIRGRWGKSAGDGSHSALVAVHDVAVLRCCMFLARLVKRCGQTSAFQAAWRVQAGPPQAT